MSEMLARTPWRHAKRSSAGLLGSLYGVRASKISHWSTFQKNILGLEAVLRQPCFSRLVRDAGATLEGTACLRRGSLAHGRSRSVGLSVSVGRSFENFGSTASAMAWMLATQCRQQQFPSEKHRHRPNAARRQSISNHQEGTESYADARSEFR